MEIIESAKRLPCPDGSKGFMLRKGIGIVFFGGKQLYELDPSNKKYLSIGQHKERIIGDLGVQTNSILITRSGTIGKVAIVPEHWKGWIPNEHIIRVVPIDDKIAGYLYAWLSSDYAYPLITRYIHGAVINEINVEQVSEIVVPLLRDENMQAGDKRHSFGSESETDGSLQLGAGSIAVA